MFMSGESSVLIDSNLPLHLKAITPVFFLVDNHANILTAVGIADAKENYGVRLTKNTNVILFTLLKTNAQDMTSKLFRMPD